MDAKASSWLSAAMKRKVLKAHQDTRYIRHVYALMFRMVGRGRGSGHIHRSYVHILYNVYARRISDSFISGDS